MDHNWNDKSEYEKKSIFDTEQKKIINWLFFTINWWIFKSGIAMCEKEVLIEGI
jgi:hypothetical protein